MIRIASSVVLLLVFSFILSTFTDLSLLLRLFKVPRKYFKEKTIVTIWIKTFLTSYLIRKHLLFSPQ